MIVGADATARLARGLPLPRGLKKNADGIWFTERQAPVAYPADGNAACLAVEDQSFWFKHRNACIVSLVRRLAPDQLFLDIGGGNGYVAKGLVEAGVDCVLVEPGLDGAVAARARGIDQVVCARLQDLELPPASIASAGMFDVLEHIEDDAAALGVVYDLLEPGGYLFLTVPAYQSLNSKDDMHAGHFRRYSLRALTRLLVATGFRIEYASYMFLPLPPLIFLFRTLPYRLGLDRDPATQDAASDHVRGGLTARMMDLALAWERNRLAMGGAVPFGGSCLCAARKA